MAFEPTSVRDRPLAQKSQYPASRIPPMTMIVEATTRRWTVGWLTLWSW